MYKAKLIEVFDFIIESDDFRNDAQTIREAVGLKNYLIDAKFCFLLDTFKLIFEQTEVIFSILQNKLTDINFARNRLLALIHILQEYRNNDRYFNDIYNNLHFDTEPSQKKRKLSYESEIKNYKQIFIEILDTVIVQIDVRFKDIYKLRFFDLLTFEKFSIYSKNFPQNLLENLLEQYSCFDEIQIKNELCVLYNDPQLFGECKTPTEMLNFINKNEFYECMPELSKLVSIVVTIPVTSASVERSFSTLKRIKTYARNTMNQNRLSSVSLISIEKGLLNLLSQNDVFYERVIDYFASRKERRIPLIYRRE